MSMSKELLPLEISKQLKDFVLEFVKNGLDRRFIHGSFDIIETALKALEIIKKGSDFSLEFDESQCEWFLYISNEEQRVLVAKGLGVKTYDLLKEVLL